MRILIFGDSISHGAGDIEGGWVSRLRKSYHLAEDEEQDYDTPSFYNLGISGKTSDDLLEYFDNEIQTRSQSDNPIIVVAIGVNDSRIDGEEYYSNPGKFEQNLEQLLNQSKSYTAKILFVGLTPCVEARTTPVAWNDVSYNNDRIEKFDATLREFCKANAVPFVEIMENFTGEQQENDMLPDGLHPNSAGHQLIADLVKPELDKLIKQ